ncbi:hypothetical protein C7S14_0699 [Burkholderia cepacia]|nr:hypothetical protein C7S14_0699 [Burkholderia cepacia]
MFEWNGAPLVQRDVRHDGSGPTKVPRGHAALARIAECVACHPWRGMRSGA